MNRKSARLLTVGGIIGSVFPVIWLIGSRAVKIEFSPPIGVSIFVAGIVLIVVSLAYYTEK